MNEAIDVLKRNGAVIVDPANMPTSSTGSRRTSSRSTSARASTTRRARTTTARSFKYGMKRDFNAYLATLGPRGAGEVADRAARVEHRARARRRDPLRPEQPRHLRRDGRRRGPRALRSRSREGLALAGEHGLEAALKNNRLDALLFPGWNISGLAVSSRFSESHRADRDGSGAPESISCRVHAAAFTLRPRSWARHAANLG